MLKIFLILNQGIDLITYHQRNMQAIQLKYSFYLQQCIKWIKYYQNNMKKSTFYLIIKPKNQPKIEG